MEPPSERSERQAAVAGTAAGGPARLSRLPLAAALLAAAVGLALTLAMPAGVFSGDEGVKLAQSRALLANGWASFALPYPGLDADPEGRYFPFEPPFVRLHDGRWYGIYSLEYTAAAALFWRLGGLRGVFLLSWLGAALALVALAALASRFLKPRLAALSVLAIAGGTPLLLYGTTNYEHTWGCALVFACLALLAAPRPTTPRLLAGGALLGLAFTVRPELAVFPLGVAGFALVLWGARRRAAARLATVALGTLAVAGLHLVLNQLLFGSLHPGLGAAGHPETTWRLNLEKLVAPEAPGATPWLLVAALAAGLLPSRRRWPGIPRLVLALAAIAVVGVAAGRSAAVVSPGMSAETRTLIGLFTATPLAVLGLLRGPLPRRQGDLAAALALASTLFVAAVVAIKVPGFWGGLELGSRYLLPAAPLLVLAGAEWIERGLQGRLRPAVALAALALLLLSVAATVVNARAMHAIRRHSERLVSAVEASGVDDVVTGKPWVPLVLAPLIPEKRIHARADGRLYRRLHDLGRRRIVSVESAAGGGTAGGVTLTPEGAPRAGVAVFHLSIDPMAAWIEANVPSGAAILREDRASAVDPGRYLVETRPLLGRLPRGFLTRGRWDYALVAAANYERFLAATGTPDHQDVQVGRAYREIRAWPLAAAFDRVEGETASRVELRRVPRDEAAHRTQRRWRASEVSWVSDPAVLPASGEGPLSFTRRWQVAVFKGRFEAGRYQIGLATAPRRRRAFLHVVAVDNREVGTFAVEGRVVVELPRRETYLLRVFLAPPSSLQAVTLRPAPGAELSEPMPAMSDE